jgi:hypothetical protein
MCQSSLQLVMIVPLIEMKGTTAPGSIEHQHISSTGGCVSVYFEVVLCSMD